MRPALISTPACAEAASLGIGGITVSMRIVSPTPTAPQSVDEVEQPAGDTALIGSGGGEE